VSLKFFRVQREPEWSYLVRATSESEIWDVVLAMGIERKLVQVSEVTGISLSMFQNFLRDKLPKPAPSTTKEGFELGFRVPPPGTYGPGDYGPDSFGGSDYV
jgi:hypothetical protein